MDAIVILKDVAYASKKGGGTVTNQNDIGELVAGAVAFLNDKGEVLKESGVTAGTIDTAVAGYADSKWFSVAVGRSNDVKVITNIPRDLATLNVVDYLETVAAVYTIGGVDAATALPIEADAEGEYSIAVTDISYSGSQIPPRIRASVYKRVGMTVEQTVDKLVARLNQIDSFVTATKINTGENFGITITAKEERTVLDVNAMDLLQDASNVVTTAYVHGKGEGGDILQMEKDYSSYEGNGNYIDYTDLHYTRPMEADASANYDGISMLWEGKHSSPSRSHNVMRRTLTIACINGAGDQNVDEVLIFLKALVGEAYTADSGIETAEDNSNELDGVSGN